MDNIQLSAAPRAQDAKPSQLRAQNILPATIYGNEMQSRSLQVDEPSFRHIYEEVGQTKLVDLTIEGDDKIRPVLIHQIQKDPLTGKLLHVEFYRVRLTEKVTASIAIEITGDSPAFKLGGIPLHNLQELEVECYPQDLVSEIVVDISDLKEFDDSIFVKDLAISDKIEILADLDELVFKILPPHQEEEEAEEEAAPADGAEPEVLTEKKDQDSAE